MAMMRLSAVSPPATKSPSTGKSAPLSPAEQQAIRSVGITVDEFCAGIDRMHRDARYENAVGAAMMGTMMGELRSAPAGKK